MPLVLIDTNVLVYSSDPAETVRQDKAARVLQYLLMSNSGCLSVQCLAEFMNVTTRPRRQIYTPIEAARQVASLIIAFPVFDLTPMVVLEAARGRRDYNLPYYDAQIWATAHLNQVPLIFSEDFTDGQVIEGVRFINPFAEAFRIEDWA